MLKSASSLLPVKYQLSSSNSGVLVSLAGRVARMPVILEAGNVAVEPTQAPASALDFRVVRTGFQPHGSTYVKMAPRQLRSRSYKSCHNATSLSLSCHCHRPSTYPPQRHIRTIITQGRRSPESQVAVSKVDLPSHLASAGHYRQPKNVGFLYIRVAFAQSYGELQG